MAEHGAKPCRRGGRPGLRSGKERPPLIVPPWINKFHILGLSPKNSSIRRAVEQGHTVFVISWINREDALGDKTFDNYMAEGPLAALDAIEEAPGPYVMTREA